MEDVRPRAKGDSKMYETSLNLFYIQPKPFPTEVRSSPWSDRRGVVCDVEPRAFEVPSVYGVGRRVLATRFFGSDEVGRDKQGDLATSRKGSIMWQ